MSAAVSERMTLAQFHALPDDPGVERELVPGELVETAETLRDRLFE